MLFLYQDLCGNFNGAKLISDTTSNSISFEKTCTSDPAFNTQACDGATYDGKVLVSNKIGDRIGHLVMAHRLGNSKKWHLR